MDSCCRYPRLARTAAITTLLLPLTAGLTHAGDWTLDNSIGLQLIYTDNLSLTGQASSGFIASVRPSLSLKGEGGRLQGSFAYAPSLSIQNGDNEQGSKVSHGLSSRFTATLIDQSLFLDMAASAHLAPTTASMSYSSDGLNLNEGMTQVYSYSLTPRSVHRFGSYASLALQASLTSVSGLGDATDTSVSASLSSGPKFTRFPWSLSLSHGQGRYDNRVDTHRSISATAGYRYSSSWLFNATVAQQSNQVYSSRSDTSGGRISGSVSWTPSPRTTASAQVGNSYFGQFWNLDFNHVSRRTKWSIGYSQDLTNVTQVFLEELVIPVEQEDGSYLGYLFYLPTSLDEDYISRSLTASVSAQGKRSNLVARLFWENRDFEVTPGTERVMGVSASASRNLSPKFSLALSASWQESRSDLAADDQVYDLGVSGSWTLGRYSSLSSGVSHRRSERVGGGYQENRLSLTFKTKMF